jgi:hypothetical protein
MAVIPAAAEPRALGSTIGLYVTTLVTRGSDQDIVWKNFRHVLVKTYHITPTQQFLEVGVLLVR